MDDLASRYVDEWAALDPVGATYVGVAGHDDELTDLSPEGFAALADLDRRTLAALATVEPAGEGERVAQEAMQERLGLAMERYDAGQVTSQLNVISSALHGVRSVFDLMPVAGERAASDIAARLRDVPRALAQLRRTYDSAADAGHISARRQIVEVAKQTDIWTDPAGDDFFPTLAARVKQAGPLPDALAADLDRYASAASEATAEFGRYLRQELAPRGRDQEAVGREQ